MSSTQQRQHSRRGSWIRKDSLGNAGGGSHHHSKSINNVNNFDSLTYILDESDAWRAHAATEHYRHRGEFWNKGKHHTSLGYLLLACVGMGQACVAYFTNLTSTFFISVSTFIRNKKQYSRTTKVDKNSFPYSNMLCFLKNKFNFVYGLLQEGRCFMAFFYFVSIQVAFAMIASIFVWIEPVSAGSGIPEVKCYLNGIDLPHVGAPKTLLCKVLGVICSVSAGLPVGKEGPMVRAGKETKVCLLSRQDASHCF